MFANSALMLATDTLLFADCKIHGLNFSPYEGDQDPNRREPISREQIERKMRKWLAIK